MRVRTTAPAKLNLYLDVLARRPDGWHDLETLFVELDWGDEVEAEVTEGEGIALECRGEVDLPAGEENLAWRAASEFLAARGTPAKVAIRLRKRVPVGAGLGGGSSDAAAVLRLLREAAGDPGDERLLALSKRLGADVPFFLHGGAAVGRGRGDEITPLPAPPSLEVVLVLPPSGHDTGRVFAHVDRRLRPAPPDGLRRATQALASGDPARVREAHYNALAGPAMAAYPEFPRFASGVERRLGRPPCLSGSGSTLYDVPDAGEAGEVLGRLDGLPGRRVLVRTKSAAPVRG